MPMAKILPFRDPGEVRGRILRAVGTLVARVGPGRMSSASIAVEAGVDEALIKRVFGGFGQLLDDFANSEAFWPPLDELAGGDPAALRGSPAGEVLSVFFRNYLRGIMDRPWTLAVMEAESRNERTLLTHALSYIRERRALEFFEAALEGDPPEGTDLSAIILLMAMAVNFLGIRSRTDRTMGGVDLHTERGQERLERTIDLLLRGALGAGGD